ncbi:hypothetical protein Goshw_016840 [Gossypium schwendimanii]|uniref:Reverse transcriptase zinc-binding domain-containing protein n=1 Tax=Gossypium schwendimanii TaxID=34291 RepID=A0A7J9KXX0_GOSSC|nr:hypothetical protein [Gossypium schwendimanii]
MWQLGHKLLPTKDKIASIHQTNDRECFKCGEKRETLIHALKDCLNARAIRTIGGLDGIIINSELSSCIDWLEEVMRNNRNNMLFRGNEETAWVIWEGVKSLSKEFRIHNMINRPILPPHMVDNKWEKPPTNKVKINFDVAIVNDKIRFGVLARDSKGFVMGGSYDFKVDRI